jgi:dolichol-phosphate mannosyltransferase
MTYEELASSDLKGMSVSLIVPTYQEVENLPILIERINRVKHQCQLEMELLIMDDDSDDGTEQYIAQLNQSWIRLIIRKENRGLSQAVIEGLNLAKHNVLIVMDADLSHPPEKIPEMLQTLRAGADFVVGSRYIEGGSTEMGWGLFRWLNSKIATLLAYPFTRIKDPMSGFIALPRTVFERGKSNLNPIGYKIGLELIVKCDCQNIHEIPLHFADRKHGQSKLSLKMQLQYLQHLRRLFIYRYDTWAHLAQFIVVGLSGVFVNLFILTILLEFNVTVKSAVAIAIAVSMISNFILNRRFTFSYARHQSMVKQFFGFCGASLIGAVVNYFTTLFVLVSFPALYPQFAALIGVLAGTGFNFTINRYLIFRHN